MGKLHNILFYKTAAIILITHAAIIFYYEKVCHNFMYKFPLIK